MVKFWITQQSLLGDGQQRRCQSYDVFSSLGQFRIVRRYSPHFWMRNSRGDVNFVLFHLWGSFALYVDIRYTLG